jgi:putative nucleotidyltransferase with HDIG domain
VRNCTNEQWSHRTTSRESTGVNVVAIQVLRVPERATLKANYNVICGIGSVDVKTKVSAHEGGSTDRVKSDSQNQRMGAITMDETMMQRDSAWCLLNEFTQSESLRKHALAVEVCMRAYARKAGADEELWGMVGLLHDFDYEKYPSPEDHPYRGCEILKDRGYSEEVRRAIMSHAEYSGVARVSPMEKTLFACDELAGFITACTLVKPSKSLAEVEAKSVRKKMKDKAFAHSVHREDIIAGAADLGLDLEEHIAFCIDAMKGIAGELGLDGSAAKSA